MAFLKKRGTDGEGKSGLFGGGIEALRTERATGLCMKTITILNKLKPWKRKMKIFEERKGRTLWDADEEKWHFSIVDVIAVLMDSPNPRKYWSVLKTN